MNASIAADDDHRKGGAKPAPARPSAGHRRGRRSPRARPPVPALTAARRRQGRPCRRRGSRRASTTIRDLRRLSSFEMNGLVLAGPEANGHGPRVAWAHAATAPAVSDTASHMGRWPIPSRRRRVTPRDREGFAASAAGMI